MEKNTVDVIEVGRLFRVSNWLTYTEALNYNINIMDCRGILITGAFNKFAVGRRITEEDLTNQDFVEYLQELITFEGGLV